MSRRLTSTERSRARGWERKHPRKAARMREGLVKFIARAIASPRRRARHKRGR
jgi:hypothetical protein